MPKLIIQTLACLVILSSGLLLNNTLSVFAQTTYTSACTQLKNSLATNLTSIQNQLVAQPDKVERTVDKEFAVAQADGKDVTNLVPAVDNLNNKIDPAKINGQIFQARINDFNNIDCNIFSPNNTVFSDLRSLQAQLNSSQNDIRDVVKTQVLPAIAQIDAQPIGPVINPIADPADSSPRIIIKFYSETDQSARTAIINSVGNESNIITLASLKLPDVVVVDVTNLSQKEAILEALNKNSAVEFAESDTQKDFTGETFQSTSPQNTQTNPPWQITNTKADLVWPNTTGNNITIGMCDTGAWPNATNLLSTQAYDISLNGNNGFVNTISNFHGTAAAGLISGYDDAFFFQHNVSGVAKDAKVLPLKVSGNNFGGETNVSILASCIKYAADKSLKIVTLGYDVASSKIINYASQYANTKGTVVIAGSGNQGIQPTLRNYNSIIAVSGYNQSGNLNVAANSGTFVDLGAPGEAMYTTEAGTYYQVTGTSFAAAIVVAVAALVLQVKPNLTSNQLMSILKQATTGVIPTDQLKYGNGKIDAQLAYNLALAS